MGREGRGKRERAGREGIKKERGEDGRETSPPIEISGYATVYRYTFCTGEGVQYVWNFAVAAM